MTPPRFVQVVQAGKQRDVRHRRPGPTFTTRPNDLCTVREAHLIAELVLREYRRKALWRRAIRALVTPLAWLAGKTAEKTAT